MPIINITLIDIIVFILQLDTTNNFKSFILSHIINMISIAK
jgi:hypothetical protein